MSTYNLLIDPGLVEPLTTASSELAELSEKISENVEQLKNLVLLLEDYQQKLGTYNDTMFLRAKVKEKIGKGNGIIMRTIDFFQQFDSLSLKQASSREDNIKISRKNQKTFEGYRERYTRALREVYKRERMYVPSQRPGLPENSVDLENVPVVLPRQEEEIKEETKERMTQSAGIPSDCVYEAPKEMTVSQGHKKKIIYGYGQRKSSDQEFRTWEEKAKDLEKELARRVWESERAKNLNLEEENPEVVAEKVDGKKVTLTAVLALVILVVVTLLLGSGRFELVSV